MSSQPDQLPPFPVDDFTLDALDHSLNGAFEVDAEGNQKLVGADYSFWQFLNFMSGYDESRLQPTDDPEVNLYNGQVYFPTDIIRSLIHEVRRLRNPVVA